MPWTYRPRPVLFSQVPSIQEGVFGFPRWCGYIGNVYGGFQKVRSGYIPLSHERMVANAWIEQPFNCSNSNSKSNSISPAIADVQSCRLPPPTSFAAHSRDHLSAWAFHTYPSWFTNNCFRVLYTLQIWPGSRGALALLISRLREWVSYGQSWPFNEGRWYRTILHTAGEVFNQHVLPLMSM